MNDNDGLPPDLIHDSKHLTESAVIALAQRGAMGHHSGDNYATCNDPAHWTQLPPLTDDQRRQLEDEIALDML